MYNVKVRPFKKKQKKSTNTKWSYNSYVFKRNKFILNDKNHFRNLKKHPLTNLERLLTILLVFGNSQNGRT